MTRVPTRLGPGSRYGCARQARGPCTVRPAQTGEIVAHARQGTITVAEMDARTAGRAARRERAQPEQQVHHPGRLGRPVPPPPLPPACRP